MFRFWKIILIILLSWLYLSRLYLQDDKVKVDKQIKELKELITVRLLGNSKNIITSTNDVNTLPEISVRQDDLKRKLSRNVIIYNRIPKCGSETISFLLQKAFAINKNWDYSIYFTRDTTRHENDFFNESYVQEFENKLESWGQNNMAGANVPNEITITNRDTKKGYIFMRHMPFMNFKKDLKPMWMNILRDPVSRAISHFYYERRGQNQLNDRGETIAYSLKFTEKEKNQTIEEVLKEIPESKQQLTISKIGLGRCQINWFCGLGTDPGTEARPGRGFGEACRRGYSYQLRNSLDKSKQGQILQKQDDLEMRKGRDLAIKHIQENYIFIGITEQFNDCLELLEYLFPTAFTINGNKKGLSELYKIWGATAKQKFKTFDKPPTEEWVKERLRKMMAYEYDVYEFARALFNEKLRYYRSIRISSE